MGGGKRRGGVLIIELRLELAYICRFLGLGRDASVAIERERLGVRHCYQISICNRSAQSLNPPVMGP